MPEPLVEGSLMVPLPGSAPRSPRAAVRAKRAALAEALQFVPDEALEAAASQLDVPARPDCAFCHGLGHISRLPTPADLAQSGLNKPGVKVDGTVRVTAVCECIPQQRRLLLDRELARRQRLAGGAGGASSVGDGDGGDGAAGNVSTANGAAGASALSPTQRRILANACAKRDQGAEAVAAAEAALSAAAAESAQAAVDEVTALLAARRQQEAAVAEAAEAAHAARMLVRDALAGGLQVLAGALGLAETVGPQEGLANAAAALRRCHEDFGRTTIEPAARCLEEADRVYSASLDAAAKAAQRAEREAQRRRKDRQEAAGEEMARQRSLLGNPRRRFAGAQARVTDLERRFGAAAGDQGCRSLADLLADSLPPAPPPEPPSVSSPAPPPSSG